jgi:hypothetical protein
MSLESPYRVGDKIGNWFKGWFVAPATTNYRFYMACDDYCNIVLGDSPMQVENTTEIAKNMNGMDYRDWWETSNAGKWPRISEWIALEEGEHYYLEAKHLEGNWRDHFSSAVEIEQSDIIGHHHSMREVQYLSVYPAQVYETTRINITNMDDGEYILLLLNPNDLKTNKTAMISANATAEELKASVKDYYINN